MVKKNGFRYLKTRGIPKKADLKAQLFFLENILLPLLDMAVNGLIKVFFCDGVHLIYGYSGSHCWCEERVCVPSAYGRKRVNCLGFMNAVTYQTETVMNDSYLNADIVCEGLKQLREKNQNIWLYVILDNAAYQRCGKVRQCAEALNINLIFLPSYSPNLNLIERLWRFLRKKVSADRFYSSFQEFFDMVKEFLSTVHIRFHSQLVSLLAYHFELFNYCVCISV